MDTKIALALCVFSGALIGAVLVVVFMQLTQKTCVRPGR